MDSSRLTNNELLDGLRKGLPSAFRQLVEDHQRKVINICFRFVNQREQAEDLAQETFVEVHRSVSSFRGESSLSTWIHRIAVSKSVDHVRRKGRTKRGGLLKRFLRLDDEADQVPSPSSDRPDSQLEEKERHRVLQQALDNLPKNQRVAFVLSKYDGMSYQEIADLLKLSLSAVESLIHRAKGSLQKSLAKYYENRL